MLLQARLAGEWDSYHPILNQKDFDSRRIDFVKVEDLPRDDHKWTDYTLPQRVEQKNLTLGYFIIIRKVLWL